MRVLFVCPSAHFAGAESSLLVLLRSLDLDRFDPLVLLPTNGHFQTVLEDLGVPTSFAAIEVWINQASARAWERFAGLRARVDALARRIEREKYDLVVTNSAVTVEGALAARKVGVPHVWRVHEMLSRHSNLKAAFPLEVYPLLLDALSVRIAVVSRAVRDELSPGVDQRRIEVVYNGLPPYDGPPASREELTGIGSDSPMIVFVGTLSAAKGVPLLADVMKSVLSRFVDARCVLVGTDVGGERPLRERARALGIEHAFRFLGFRNDVMDVIGTADVLIHPSEVDSLPCAVMEAMAAGVPAVATRSGGAVEMIVDGQTGHLVDVGDVRAMARALEALLGDDEERREMGWIARSRARAVFSADAYVGAMQRLFERVVEMPPPRQDGAELSRLIDELEGLAVARHDQALASSVADRLRAMAVTATEPSPGSGRGGTRCGDEYPSRAAPAPPRDRR